MRSKRKIDARALSSLRVYLAIRRKGAIDFLIGVYQITAKVRCLAYIFHDLLFKVNKLHNTII